MKKGQIWVETVIYILIAFSMIGLILAFIVPKISEIKDQRTIEHSIKMMEDINEIVKDLGVAGNQRILELNINKGSLTINSSDDSLNFKIDSSYTFSEPGQEVTIGEITAITVDLGEIKKVTLTIKYNNYNIQYNENEELYVLSQASTPYKILISNKGLDTGSKPKIDFKLI